MATKKRKSSKSTNNLVYALLYIIMGVLFIAFKGGMLNVLLTIIGALFIVSGIIVYVTKKDLLSALISVAIGIVIILGGWLFLKLVLIIFGVLFIIKGIVDLVQSFQRKNFAGILGAVITILIGGLLIGLNWLAHDWLYIVIGVVLIANGAMLLLGKALFGKK